MTVTTMPEVASQLRSSRIVGVEFPFGRVFGTPHDEATQLAVAGAAVDLLANATKPETRVDLDLEWPMDPKEAYREWQPPVPSPIVQLLIDRLAAGRAAARAEAAAE